MKNYEATSTELIEDTMQGDPDVLKHKSEKFGTDLTFKRKIVWVNVIVFLILHVCALYGIYLTSKAHWYTIFWGVFVGLAGAEGIKAGAHRLYSHKAYKAKPLLRFILITLQTLSGQLCIAMTTLFCLSTYMSFANLEHPDMIFSIVSPHLCKLFAIILSCVATLNLLVSNCLYIWVRDHRQHHKYSDTDADPHNPTRGFFFAHMGWLMSKKHPLVIKMGKTIDMSDLEADKMVMFQKDYYIALYLVVALFIPVAVPIYFWNESLQNALFTCFFFRYVSQLNFTWLVNSWAHRYGTRPYNKKIAPAEAHFVSYVTLGGGWHNYHHVFPWDYKASELGAPANFTRFLIEFWASIGWAYDLKSASDSVIERCILNCGDGSVPKYSFLKNKIENTNDTQDTMETPNLDDNEHSVSNNDQ